MANLFDLLHQAFTRKDKAAIKQLEQRINNTYSTTRGDYSYHIEEAAKDPAAYTYADRSMSRTARQGEKLARNTQARSLAADIQGGQIRIPVIPHGPGKTHYITKKLLRNVQDPIHLGSEDIGFHFQRLTPEQLSAQPNRYTQPISVLDIETGHNDEPLSLSVLKGVIDRKSGQFLVTDTLEHYYEPTNTKSEKFFTALEVHGLSPERLASYRSAQGAQYPKQYLGSSEKSDLLEFLKGSLVVGQSVENADFGWLGISQEMQQYKTLDTLTVAENLDIPKGKRGLEALYKRFLGRTFKQAGYKHHMSFHDVMMTAEIFASMYRMQNNEGRDIRYVTNHPGVSYVTHSEIAGTSISKRGYWGPANIGERAYMYEDDYDYNDDHLSDDFHDEAGHEHMPEGFGVENPWGESDLDMSLKAMSDLKSFSHDTIQEFTTALQEMTASLSAYNSTRMLQIESKVAHLGAAEGIAYLRSHGYNPEAGAGKALLERAGYLKRSRIHDQLQTRKQQITEARNRGLITPEQEIALYNEAADENADPENLKYRLRGMAFGTRVMKQIHQAYKNGHISRRDMNRLENSPEALTGSYAELADATEELIKKNQQLYKIYTDLSHIKPYDINQYVQSAHSHIKGILGDARGLVPGFILNPMSHITSAAFNSVERRLAPFNAIQRTWNSGIGQAVTGALTGGMGIAGFGIGSAITGGVNALSQIVGNVSQAKMERSLLGIQNSVNTVNAGVSWLLTPFQLLGKALKVATSLFSGLNVSLLRTGSRINQFMGTNIEAMGQMGNPLQPLTGVDYVAYQHTRLMDTASLLHSGNVNADIESFATTQRNLYRFGQVDTGKLLAANMLGVFSEAFTPTGDAKEAYYNMANKILHNMQGQDELQQADTMFYATQLSSTLAQVLRTALMYKVSDVRELESSAGMYWRPISEEEEGQFRTVNRQYNTAQQQWGYSKQRIAVRLWNAIGRDVYDGVNKVVDRLADNDWKGTLDEVSKIWEQIKQKASSAWQGDVGEEVKKWYNSFKESGLSTIKSWAIGAGNIVIDVWNTVVEKVVDKVSGLIAHLSTMSISIEKDGKGRWRPVFHSLSQYASPAGDTQLFEYTKTGFGPNDYTYKWISESARQKYQPLYDALRAKGVNLPNLMTRDDLETAVTMQLHEPISIPEFGIRNWDTSSPNSVSKLLRFIDLIHAEGYGPYTYEAAANALGIPSEWLDPDYKHPMHETLQSGALQLQHLADETRKTLVGAIGGAPTDVGSTSDTHKYEFVIKIGDRTITVNAAQGKVNISGMPALGTVQISKGITLAVNQQQ